MRLLVLTDIHSNLEAFEAVLSDAPSHDGILFLGDLVGYGPNPNECCELLRGLPMVSALVGNHDLAALGKLDIELFNPIAKEANLWTGKQLTKENRDYLLSLPPSRSIESLGIFMAHASPCDPIWEYMVMPQQGLANFAAFSENLAFVGHSHQPRVFQDMHGGMSHVFVPKPDDCFHVSGLRWIMNVGGVGQPRDGNPKAAYGLYDYDRGELRFHRVRYSIETTQRKILDAGLPSFLAERLSHGA